MTFSLRSRRALSASLFSAVLISIGLLPHSFPAWAEQAAKASPEPAPERVAPKPSPQLTPEGVIKIQVRELSSPGEVADRIERCYQFASPDNRAYTGPLDRFAKMVQSPQYDVLLNAKHFLVGRATIEKNQAHVLLSVVNQQNQLVLFRCFLSKQTKPEVKDCWMTDAVVSIGSAEKPEPAEPQASPTI